MAGADTTAAGDIAIVGMACVFPGADGPEAFWGNICASQDRIGEPPVEWGAARYLNGIGPTRITTAAGGYLGDLYRFDPAELGVMPSSVDGSEPDQFLALKAARDALADAGYLGPGHDHTTTGIVLGHSTYLHRGNATLVQHGMMVDQMVSLFREILPDAPEPALAQLRAALVKQLPPFNSDVMPGMVPNVMTGRIANRLDLRGPNYIIDAACASSLLAVHTAMEELRAGRSDLMLAGGVNASTPAEAYMVFSQLGALSRRSKVRPFDAESDGTLLGEGLGVVALRRLNDALAAGDRVYAVIKSVGQSSDGKGAGLLAPRLEGEVLAIRRAFADALIPPDTIGLVEAHGTGIPLGDRTEIQALREIFGNRTGEMPRAALGTVKSMIGHCIPAAGIAGLIKTALALYYRTLPPTLLDAVQPALGLDTTPFYVNTEARPWIQPLGAPRRAGINAFGFGGVNSHAILEEAPEPQAPRRPAHLPAELVVLADATPEKLAARIGRLQAALAGQLADVPLCVVAAALVRRDGIAGPVRLALVATDAEDLIDKLQKARDRLDGGRAVFQVRSGIYAGDSTAEGKIAFVFPGEGAQYPGMLADVLTAFPEARRWFDFWDGIYGDRRGFRSSAAVFPPPTTLDKDVGERLERALFGLELGSESVFIATQALLAVVDRLGFRANALLGHSSGEHAALRAAGVFGGDGWQELERQIRELNRLYKNMEAEGELITGALLTVGAVPRERTLALADGKAVHVALDNCHQQTVLYGSRETLEQLATTLGREGALCAFLPFDRPYHTPLFAPVAEMVERIYGAMEFRAPKVPLYSCVTAAPMPSSPDRIRALAAEQWRTRVRFTETIQQMYTDGFRTFIEVGPSANLTGFIENVLQGKDILAVSLDSRRRSSLTQLLHALGRIWVTGRDLDLGALITDRPIPAVDLDMAEPLKSKARVVPNTLPFLRLPASEVEHIRAALRPAHATSSAAQSTTTSVPPATPEHSPHASSAPATAPAYPAGAASAAPDPGVLSGHFSLMQAFLDTQEAVMTAALAGAGAPADESYPFLQRILVREEDRIVAECDLHLGQEFVRQHVLYAIEVSDLDPGLTSLPVVPMAVSMEMLAEAASAVTGGLSPARLEQVTAANWVALDEGSCTVTIEAVLLSSVAAETRVGARVLDAAGSPLVQAEVVFADEPSAPVELPAPLENPRAPIWQDHELYTTGMFHGPLYHSVRGLLAWDDAGIDAVLADTALDGFFEPGRRPRFVINPVLLDAIGHVTAFWIAQRLGTDFSSFPSRIERIELFQAHREDTAGSLISARLGFETGDAGGRFLTGDFTCMGPEGRLLFRAIGWRDRFFDVPHRFYFARFAPRDGFYGDDVSGLFSSLPLSALVWRVPAFPKGFLDDAGGIWRRVLASTILSGEERQQWKGLPGQQRRRDEWLIGRVALKEAARAWIERTHGQRLFPADLVIRVPEGGKPYIAGDGLEGLGELPEVSLAHVDGQAVAVAAPASVPVGIDLERAGRIMTPDLLAGGFSEVEKSTLFGSGSDPARVLQAWCAKEAAAKCLGEGLNGRPKSFVVRALDGNGNAQVSADSGTFEVALAADGTATLAVAWPAAAGA